MKRILLLFSVFLLFVNMLSGQPERGYHVNVGDSISNISLNMLDGSIIDLKDYKDKVVVLQFTASWCSVCRKEMPYLEKEVWLENKNDDFILIAVDLKEDPEKVRSYIMKTGITYPVAIDADGSVFAQFAYENAGVTRNVVIGKDGKIAYLTRLFDRNEFDEMKKAISELLLK